MHKTTCSSGPFSTKLLIDHLEAIIDTILHIVNSVAYLRFHFGGGGGGVQNIFVKVGVFAWRLRGEATRLLRGFGGMFPRENFKKWCYLVRFGKYFAKML